MDTVRRYLVVRPPAGEARVVIRVEARGSSSQIFTLPDGGADSSAQMRAVLAVMDDAALTPGPLAWNDAVRGLPNSRWITALFISPRGRLWSARTGLFSADSLFGQWGRSFGGPGDPVDPDDLAIGTHLGFVSDQVMVLGTGGEIWENRPLLYRTVDGGASWSNLPVGSFEDVRAIRAIGASVWIFATQVKGEGHDQIFLRSADGGESWTRVPLPPGIRYVTELYRVTRDTAYVAGAGFDPGPVFWRTTDGGNHWTPVRTPHDQQLHRVPENGVHIQHVATVGDRLVVLEYGRAFHTSRDLISWRPLDGVKHLAADRARDRLFVVSDRLEPAMLDRDLVVVWRGARRIPNANPSDVEAVAVHDGVGYLVMRMGEIHEVRDGGVRLRRPE